MEAGVLDERSREVVMATDTAAGGQDTRGTRSVARDAILSRGIDRAITRVVDVGNLVVGIGWLRTVSTDQLHRLWMPRKHPDAVGSVAATTL
jgi:hypothetical protein